MTAAQPLHPSEPPPPQRGQTRDVRGHDVSQSQAEAETSKWKQFTHAMSPRLVWSMAEGCPANRAKYKKK